jgi:hypothetical protein
MSGAEPSRNDASGAAVPADRCPLCGGGNACAIAAGSDPGSPCWCVAAAFDAELLARVPLGARGRACICAACAAASKARA